MKISLRQLEVFDAVATLGSVSRAAQHLGMSQSAASSALNDLQIILGRQLFAHVKGRALQITDEGKQLQATVRSVLRSVQDIEIARDAPLRGKLVIGATAMIAEHIMPAICARFLARHPGVQVMIESAPSIDLYDRLSRYELETALIENFPEVEGFELVMWRADELWLVVSPDHSLARRKRLAIRDLAGAHWCMREWRSTTAFRLRWLLHEQLGQLPIAVESTSNETLRQMCLNNVGIACLSRVIIEDDVAAGRLVRLDVADFQCTRTLSLARPKGSSRSRLAATFDEFLLEGSQLRCMDGHRPSETSDRGIREFDDRLEQERVVHDLFNHMMTKK